MLVALARPQPDRRPDAIRAMPSWAEALAVN